MLQSEITHPQVSLPTPYDIEQAHNYNRRSDSLVRPAQIIAAPNLAREIGAASLHLISDAQQYSGAYKIRGFVNKMRNIDPDDSGKDISLASAGNHARAGALVAEHMGLQCHTFVPEGTPDIKYRPLLEMEHVSVQTIGETVDETLEAAQSFALENDFVFVHPFDDPHIIAGQGTLGAELWKQLPRTNVVIAPVGGGGLLSGVSTYLRHQNSSIHFVGVEPLGAASLTHALATGQTEYGLPAIDTFVDGAAVKRVGNLAHRILADYGDMLTVVKAHNDQTRRATTELRERYNIPSELAGALGMAAVRIIGSRVHDKHVAVYVTGSNLCEQRYQEEVRLTRS